MHRLRYSERQDYFTDRKGTLHIWMKFTFGKIKSKNNMPNKNIGAENVRWELGAFYAGIGDPRIDADVAELVNKEKIFAENFRGKLEEKLGEAISAFAEITMLQEKIMVYLALAQSLDLGNAAVNAKIAEVERTLSLAAGEYLAFFDIELVSLGEETLAKFYAADAVVAKHRPWIEHARVWRPHLLSEEVEGALAKRAPFGPDSWNEFYDEVESGLEFDFRGEKKTLTEILHLLTESRDAEERAELLQLVNGGFKGPFAKYSAQTLYMVAGSVATERKERKYRHPMETRNKSNRVPDAVVDALHEAVMTRGGELAKRYYRLKASHLGMTKLRWSDRNAPMPFSDSSAIPFSQGMEVVLSAYESFSPTLAEIIRDFIKAKSIDAPARKGKRSGAFNISLVAPGNQPLSFVLLNYLGSKRDIMTLAHELGHGAHGMLAGAAQGALMQQAPTAYAETASVFGEMTTFNFLKNSPELRMDKKTLLALIMGKIDDIINTVVRQIGFSNFERRVHGMDASYGEWLEPKKMSAEELNGIWLGTLKELYGEEGDVFTYEDADYLWSYVSYFHRPFYAYGYAFGELLTQSLYAERPRLGSKFEPLYLEMLRAGGTKDATELLRPFGIDPANKEFWLNGLNISLGKMIDEAEELSRSLGISV